MIETVKVADAPIDRFIAVMVRDRDAVNVAEAEMIFWSVFCFVIDTVKVADDNIDSYICLTIDTANVADAAIIL